MLEELHSHRFVGGVGGTSGAGGGDCFLLLGLGLGLGPGSGAACICTNVVLAFWTGGAPGLVLSRLAGCRVVRGAPEEGDGRAGQRAATVQHAEAEGNPEQRG